MKEIDDALEFIELAFESLAANPKLWKYLASMYYQVYTAMKAEGFTDEQSFAITIEAAGKFSGALQKT